MVEGPIQTAIADSPSSSCHAQLSHGDAHTIVRKYLIRILQTQGKIRSLGRWLSTDCPLSGLAASGWPLAFDQQQLVD